MSYDELDDLSVEPEENEPVTEGDSAASLLTVDNLIKNHISKIETLSSQLKEQREILEDILINDPVYREHSEQAKEAVKQKTATKAQILKQAQPADISNKIKSLRSEVKDLQNSLSEYLQEYARVSGTKEIEDNEGALREIIYIAKLIKKSAKFY